MVNNLRESKKLFIVQNQLLKWDHFTSAEQLPGDLYGLSIDVSRQANP